MKRMMLVCLMLLAGSGVLWGAGMKKRKPLPQDYGSVTINNFSQQAGMAPVVFDHWVHRRYYTCRLCHVDIGFGMAANSTKMRAADNAKGFFCGTCHDGSTVNGKSKIFASCATAYTREDYKRCVKCHAIEKDPVKEELFSMFMEMMPREQQGNGINWQKAEENGLIYPVDNLEGVSARKSSMKVQPDFALKPKVEGMPDIIFSHAKHTVWNGCEVCHPDIFVGIKQGATKYSMIDLFEGKYCGVCHDKVAFPQTDCKRCHARPVS